jgi:hypothetical protein
VLGREKEDEELVDELDEDHIEILSISLSFLDNNQLI